MQPLIRRISFLVLAGAAAFAQAAPLPEASPEEVGMSTERLGRLDALMQKAVDSGELPGAVVFIAGDYLRFAQMLANGGDLDGARILGPRTVEYMTANHVNPQIDKGPTYLPGPGYGFGLGFASRVDRGQSEWPGSPGDFFWSGYAGTYFWVDPEEELVPVLMSREPVRRQYYRVLMRNLVYQSIIK